MLYMLFEPRFDIWRRLFAKQSLELGDRGTRNLGHKIWCPKMAADIENRLIAICFNSRSFSIRQAFWIPGASFQSNRSAAANPSFIRDKILAAFNGRFPQANRGEVRLKRAGDGSTEKQRRRDRLLRWENTGPKGTRSSSDENILERYAFSRESGRASCRARLSFR
jgi:hypothetical protein